MGGLTYLALYERLERPKWRRRSRLRFAVQLRWGPVRPRSEAHSEEHSIPWNKLTYDTSLGGYRTGYRTDLTEEQVRGVPAFSRDRNWDGSDRTREQQLHDYYRAPYYWDE
jgi:hypothetical protein